MYKKLNNFTIFPSVWRWLHWSKASFALW